MVPIRQINPGLSKGLEKIILKCCQQKPEDRYQDCLELLYALENDIDVDEKKDEKRFKLFLATSILCVVMAIAGTGFLLASNSQKSANFSSLIEVATDGTIQLSNDERVSDCRSAISLDPDNIDGYRALLSVISSTDPCCSDQSITAEEASALEIISTNRAALTAASEEEFGKLCYDVGHAIWFNYRNDQDDETAKMKQAMGWFLDAQTYLPEDSEYYNLAKLYYQIGDYNQNIQTRIDQDDDKGAYKAYWDAMEGMLDLAAGETNYARLQMYRLAVNSIVRYAKSFSNDGVTSQDLLDVLDEVETGLGKLEFNEGTNSDILQQTLDSVASARRTAEQVD